MQRQRGELVPVAEALADLPGPVQAIRRNGRSFTLADQVNRLVSASEAPADLGFMGAERWRCVPCPEAPPATSISISG